MHFVTFGLMRILHMNRSSLYLVFARAQHLPFPRLRNIIPSALFLSQLPRSLLRTLPLARLDLQQRIEFALRVTVRPACPVRPGKVLPIVAHKVEVVQRVVCGTVDRVLERVPGDHV